MFIRSRWFLKPKRRFWHHIDFALLVKIFNIQCYDSKYTPGNNCAKSGPLRDSVLKKKLFTTRVVNYFCVQTQSFCLPRSEKVGCIVKLVLLLAASDDCGSLDASFAKQKVWVDASVLRSMVLTRDITESLLEGCACFCLVGANCDCTVTSFSSSAFRTFVMELDLFGARSSCFCLRAREPFDKDLEFSCKRKQHDSEADDSVSNRTGYTPAENVEFETPI